MVEVRAWWDGWIRIVGRRGMKGRCTFCFVPLKVFSSIFFPRLSAEGTDGSFGNGILRKLVVTRHPGYEEQTDVQSLLKDRIDAAGCMWLRTELCL